MTPQPRIVIVGAGGHAASVAEAARAGGSDVCGYVDTSSAQLPVLDAPVYRSLSEAGPLRADRVVVAVGDNYQREQLWGEIKATQPDLVAGTVIHPRAVVASNAIIEEGSVILAGAVVGSRASISTFAIINSGAIIDHDCHLGDFSSVGPGATLGGRVHVGRGSAVAIGAVVREGCSIGENSVLGAGSYLHGNLASDVVAYGSPAQVQNSRNPGDPYLR